MSQIPAIRNAMTIGKVDVGSAERIFTDRRQNPSEMTCPLWAGQDIAGRVVCADSFVSKMEGCHTAEDRIFVENGLRPQYTNYVTLDAAGVSGNGMYRKNLIAETADAGTAYKARLLNRAPRFGTVNGEKLTGLVGGRGDVIAANARAQDVSAASSQSSRVRQAVAIGAQSQKRVDARYNTHVYPNPNGDYMNRSADSQGYLKVRDYNVVAAGRLR